MRHLPNILALCLIPILDAAASSPSCTPLEPQYAALSSTVWLTTAVYEDGNRAIDLSEKYPAVVGISLWDACRNRFEYFDPRTGDSRSAIGGSGYFLFTGDGNYQITLPDHSGPVRRRMDVMTPQEFTYSRTVPEGMATGSREVVIQVVHTPYQGVLPIPAAPRSGPD